MFFVTIFYILFGFQFIVIASANEKENNFYLTSQNKNVSIFELF